MHRGNEPSILLQLPAADNQFEALGEDILLI